MKKEKFPHLKFLWDLSKGNRGRYIVFLTATVLSVFCNVINAFIAKLLIDSIKGEILIDSKIGPFGVFLRNLFGGGEFLMNNLWIFAIIIASIALVTLGLSFIRIYFRGRVGNSLTRKMQMKLFTHIENIPYDSFKKFKSGDIIQTCTRDQMMIRRTMSMQLGMIVWTISTAVFSFLMLVLVSWQVALTSIVSIPFLFIYSFFAIRKVEKLYRRWDDSEGRLLSKIEENLAAVRTVKVYNNEPFELKDFDNYINDFSDKFVRLRLFSAFYFSSSDIFVIGGLIFSLVMCGVFTFNGIINVGTLMISFTYVNMIVWPVREVAQVLSNLAQTFASIDRMKLILDEPLEDLESGISEHEMIGKIECVNMSYKYTDASVAALHDINLTINPGETVALIGKTGSGKSTFVHLLSALFDYTSGSIKIDGIELRDYSKRFLRSKVSSVLQDPYLFSKTVIGNLKLVNDKLNQKEIDQALRIANLDKTIERLPKGLETEIGEKGATLSGGQRQRLSIARSLIQDAPIMVFDDSLSALDTQTDYEIRMQLKMRDKKTTTIIITHRMQTAKDADKIIVFDQGTIESIGSHDELMKKDGIYKRIYEIQTGLFKKELN